MSKGTEFVEDYMKKLYAEKSPSPKIHGASAGAKFIEDYMEKLHEKNGELPSSEKKEPPVAEENTSYVTDAPTPAETPEESEPHIETEQSVAVNAEELESIKAILENPPDVFDENGHTHTLKVSSLYKSFGKKNVVQGIDFSMRTGEILGLLGPNGSGKTTTFYMIVGFLRPTRGEVFFDGKQITKLAMYKRARLGISYLPQEPSVFKKLTVEENIWAVLEMRKDLPRAQKKQQLENLIEEFSIGHIRKQPAFTLSGGERRRTEIARALAMEPKFLLLDEPFAGIDPIAVADIKSVIKQLSDRDIGLLITDHNVRDTLEITHRAIIINNGNIMMQGSRDAILDSPVAREVYLGKDFSM